METRTLKLYVKGYSDGWKGLWEHFKWLGKDDCLLYHNHIITITTSTPILIYQISLVREEKNK